MPRKTVLSVVGVEPRRTGGIETFCRELSSQLCDYGWQSVLVFLGEPSDNVRQFLDSSNVSLEVLRNSWKLGFRPTWDLGGIMRKYRPTVVHSQFTPFVGPYPWLSKLFWADRIFFTEQGSSLFDDEVRNAPFWKRTLVRKINFPISKVFCVSEYVCNRLRNRGLMPPDRFEVLYNAVDIHRAVIGRGKGDVFRARYSIPSNRVVVSQVGQMIPEKGIEDLLRAMKFAIEKNRNLQCVLAGDGPSLPDFENLASELEIADHVTFTGLVTDPIVDGLFDASDIVCQVSRWQEAFGFTIAEAMSTGKPVIGTRVGGIPELICDGDSGFLIQRCDVVALAKCIISLSANPGLRDTMGKAGRRRCVAKFNLSNQVKTLLRAYGVSSSCG